MSSLQRPRRRRRPPLLWLSAPVAALLILCWGKAFAGPSSGAWPFEWRPNWIPGDPAPATLILATPWDLVGPSATPGLLVALDPVSRLPIPPSAAQRAALAAQFDAGGPDLAPDVTLPTERIPGGGELVHLQGRFQIYTVARRGADGRFTTSCVAGPREGK